MMISIPKILKYFTLAIFVGIVVYLIIHLMSKNTPTSTQTKLSKVLNPTLTAVSNDFQYVHNSNGIDRFVLTAKKDTAFSSGLHQLEEVKLQAFDENKKTAGTLIAKSAEYDSQSNVATFKEKVTITTEEGLIIRTEEMKYDQATEVISTEFPIEFEGEKFKGTCLGASLESKNKHLILSKNVKIDIPPESSKITADHAEYWKEKQQIVLTGNAHITRNKDELKAEQITAFLDEKQNIKQIESRLKSFIKSEEKQGQLEAQEMDFKFDSEGKIQTLVARNNVSVKTNDKISPKEAFGNKLVVSFSKNKNENVLDQIILSGQAQVKFLSTTTPTNNQQKITNKELVADEVCIKYLPDGRFLKNAQATGNAVLTVIPTIVDANADSKKISAQKLNALFYPTNNQVRTFSTEGKTKIEIAPVIAQTQRLVRTTESDSAIAHFNEISGDVVQIIQEGNFIFHEGTKQAKANQATYLQIKETTLLRGGRPTIWDDKARIQADEIDLSNVTTSHTARGQIRTTYYTRDGLNNSAPFSKIKSPIFITSNEVQIDSQNEAAIYLGNARMWQEDNFISCNRLELFQKNKQLIATGKVSSALYQVERTTEDNKKQIIPIFGNAEKLTYTDSKKHIRYEQHVFLTQETDTLSSAIADIYLQSETNKIDYFVATDNVIITQPQRRATGKWAKYTAKDESFVITGNMACVEDKEHGITTGPKLTFYKSENKVSATDQNHTQRIRTKYRINN